MNFSYNIGYFIRDKIIFFGPKYNKLFDTSILEILLNLIISLTFGFWFNQPVDNLPNSIQNLTFGQSFNQEIKKIPTKLKKVHIVNFNKNKKKISKSFIQTNPSIKIK